MSKRKKNPNDAEASTSASIEESLPIHCVVGKIKTVYCKNFVTYEECSFSPTEYLNVIIGPNGTGKSTLVAAIVIGLGGEPKLLSRASALSDYVKNGRDAAIVNVEIHKEYDKAVTFQRTFDRSGKSEYKVNEDTVSRKDFLKEIAVFNIQINNLCQFLPQDRVQDFAKMNPQELLLNTITSVCNSNVIENFYKLKELRKTQLNCKKSQDSDIKKLKESMARLDELKQKLDRYNERNECLEKMNACKVKIMSLKIADMKEKIKEFEKDCNLAKKRFEARQKTLKDLESQQAKITATKSLLAKESNEKEQKLLSVLERKKAISEQIEDQRKAIQMAKIDIEKSKRESADQRKDMQNATQIFEVLTQDLRDIKAKIGNHTELVEKSQQFDGKLEDLKNEALKLVKKRTAINKVLEEEYVSETQMLKKRISISENVAEHKLQLLQNKYPDLYTAVLWLRDHEAMFEAKVYKPMILELNVIDPNHAKYFENTIQLRDLIAFTCESKSDMSRLTEELCIKKKLSVNVVHSAAAESCLYRPNESINNLRSYGFSAYLIDLIEGPPAILNYLCSLYKLHAIPIGTEQVNKHTDSIPTNIRLYFGGNNRYAVSISKYSNEPSLMQTNINSRNMLSSRNSNEISAMKARLNELLKKSDELKNERTKIESKISEIEFQREEVKKQKRDIGVNTTKLSYLVDKTKRQRQEIDRLEKNLIDIPQKEQAFANTVARYVTKILDLQKEEINALRLYQTSLAERNFCQSKVYIYRQENEEFTNAMADAQKEQKEAKELVDTITYKIEESKRKCKFEMSEYNTAKSSITNEVFVNELPNGMEDLKEAVNVFSARLDCMDDVDQRILQEYETRADDIAMLKRQIETDLHGFENNQSKIEDIHKDWFPEINRLIYALNTQFGQFMESINYAGEILLIRQNEYDFDTYGIQIMVQFRSNVALQPLNRQVQSGGERAVAIALYTLSLQNLTQVPFRCVDEINQGMDSRNERKVFEMLVAQTTQVGCSQFFFVTPKLLPNLTFNENVSVHIVFNGKSIKPNNAFAFNI